MMLGSISVYIHVHAWNIKFIFGLFTIEGWIYSAGTKYLAGAYNILFVFLLSFTLWIHNEMFSSVSNKLFKMVHLAFATTGSLFSSKTHSAKDFYIIKVQIWIVQFVYDCITIFWTFSTTLILFSFFIFFMFSLVSNLKFKIFKSNFKQKYIMVRSVQLHHNFLTLTFSVRPWHYLFCLYNMI